MNDPTTAVATIEPRALADSLDLAGVKRHVNLVQSIMQEVMKDKEHYGTIPGCGDKRVLMKSGAEKLCFTFQLVPTFAITRNDLVNGHREYEVVCRLTTRGGVLVAEGVGCCSTMESKYRYRGGGYENTGEALPREYWDMKKSPNKADNDRAVAMIGGKGFVPKKTEDGWFIFKSTGEKAEHPDIADTYNTVLKMAKKRAHVDATITATAASDIFTQDIDEEYEAAPVKQAAAAAAPRAEEKTPAQGTTVGKPDGASATAAPSARAAAAPSPASSQPISSAKTAASPTTGTTSPSARPTPGATSATPLSDAGNVAKAACTELYDRLKEVGGEEFATAVWFSAPTGWPARHLLLSQAIDSLNSIDERLGKAQSLKLTGEIIKRGGFDPKAWADAQKPMGTADQKEKVRAIVAQLVHTCETGEAPVAVAATAGTSTEFVDEPPF